MIDSELGPPPPPPVGPDKYCPLMQAQCNSKKGCQRCVFWTPVAQEVKPGLFSWKFDCSLKQAAEFSVYMNQRLGAMQTATEQLRNRFTEFHQSIVALVGTLYRLAAPEPVKVLELKDVSVVN